MFQIVHYWLLRTVLSDWWSIIWVIRAKFSSLVYGIFTTSAKFQIFRFASLSPSISPRRVSSSSFSLSYLYNYSSFFSGRKVNFLCRVHTINIPRILTWPNLENWLIFQFKKKFQPHPENWFIFQFEEHDLFIILLYVSSCYTFCFSDSRRFVHLLTENRRLHLHRNLEILRFDQARVPCHHDDFKNVKL